MALFQLRFRTCKSVSDSSEAAKDNDEGAASKFPLQSKEQPL